MSNMCTLGNALCLSVYGALREAKAKPASTAVPDWHTPKNSSAAVWLKWMRNLSFVVTDVIVTLVGDLKGSAWVMWPSWPSSWPGLKAGWMLPGFGGQVKGIINITHRNIRFIRFTPALKKISTHMGEQQRFRASRKCGCRMLFGLTVTSTEQNCRLETLNADDKALKLVTLVFYEWIQCKRRVWQ